MGKVGSAKAFLLRNPLPRVPWRNRDVVVVLLLCSVLPIAVFVLILVGSKTLEFAQPVYNTLKKDDLVAGMVLQILTLVFEVGLLYWVLRRRHARLSDLGFRPFSWWRAAISVLVSIILLSVLVSIVYSLVAWALPSFNADQAQDVGFEYGKVGIGLWISGFFTVIVAPIVEETYFRGFVLPALSQRLGILLGALVSSGLFAALHFQTNVVIYTFILGLILCYLYAKYKSTVVGIVLHTINNAIAFAFLAGFIR